MGEGISVDTCACVWDGMSICTVGESTCVFRGKRMPEMHIWEKKEKKGATTNDK